MRTDRACFNCGAAVGDNDYELVGHQRIYACTAAACERVLCDELAIFQAEIEEEARLDNYERYRR